MIVIIDYGMSNSGSIKNMIKKVGAVGEISSDPEVIAKAEKLVLPGVGNYDLAMRNIEALGLREVLDRRVLKDRIPILGVCLGMQLMTKSSAEGTGKGFGWFNATTRRFDKDVSDPPLRIPHMGWNHIDIKKPSPLFDEDGLTEHRYYFVHSYAVTSDQESEVLCTSHYGTDFVSGLARDNIVGLQFHPEKSHAFGMSVFKRFVELY